ncbi:GNAT family acetyltransferase [Listeria weihenstephanensis FSL R9-0317]|uniref:GNAT family N-acetyltransferase n=1 Tax=Listeria weihenstephanensis TaxID=1006155 RepID=A0A1S7FVE2_9LIST|nr:GNAT family N-acetyltransferase [Listeria weihenstephanensis]AQY51362.1 hypothetical protein UE46_10030 [Listeria weihenstephanensis]EUJ37161.1 GNAT family acetyltransferase [Listeria weihenstephanensis FSL R9-0317]MBC1500847.1 GNAT family N-acetyltransferase [Listeria weihenstephanensis]
MLVGGHAYTFRKDYQETDVLRQEFNRLTRNTYGFDLEKWYQNGYWSEGCHLYSLFDGEAIVSHVTVSEMAFSVLGERQKFVQIGTVMTDEFYQKRGLSKALLEVVLREWETKCDLIYLFANDAVLDFYPKFGFVSVNEYQVTKSVPVQRKNNPVRQLDLGIKADRDFLFRVAAEAFPQGRLAMLGGAGMVMLYCGHFELFTLENNLFYIEELDAIAVAEYDGVDLILHDILASEKVDVELVIDALVKDETNRVTLGFMPNDMTTYDVALLKEEDSTLFVKRGKESLFEKNKLIFPLLSHT